MLPTVKLNTRDGTTEVDRDQIFAILEGARPHTCYVHLRSSGYRNRPRMLVVEEDTEQVKARCFGILQG